MPDNLDLEQLNPIKQIGIFFSKISLKITSNKNFVTTLSHITKYCTRLHDLSILGSGSRSEEELFVYEEDSVRSYSVKVLVLIECILSQEQLFYIVTQFPNLMELVLKNRFMHTAVLGQRFYSIDLPTLSLEYLEIDFDKDFDGDGSYHFKLMSDTGPRYCFLTAECNNNKKIIGYSTLKYNITRNNAIDNAIESAFRDSILNQRVSTYIVHCPSVKNFTVKYTAPENGHHKKIELIPNSSIM